MTGGRWFSPTCEPWGLDSGQQHGRKCLFAKSSHLSTGCCVVKGDPGSVSRPNQLVRYWESESVHCALGKHTASRTIAPEIYEEQVGNAQHEERMKREVRG